MTAGVSHLRGLMRPDYRPNDEVYTPPHIFEALGLEFDLDVCGPIGSTTEGFVREIVAWGAGVRAR